MFLASWNFPLHGDHLKERFSLNIFSVDFKLEGNFSCIFKEDFFSVPFTELELSKIKFLLTDFTTNQRWITFKFDLIVRSSLNMTDCSSSVKNSSLGIVDKLNFLDLTGFKYSRQRKDVKNLVDGNWSREHRVGRDIHFVLLSNYFLFQKCPFISDVHQWYIFHQHCDLFGSVIQNSTEIDNWSL